MPMGPPKWSSTMVVSGNARARLMASGIWVWAHQTSKLSLRGAEMLEARAEVVAQQQALGRVGAVVLDVGARVPEGAAPDAAEAPAAGRDLRVEDVGGGIADAQVDGADDAGGDPGLAVGARRAHGGDAVHELGLADAAIVLGAVGLEHGPAFDEHGRDDVVPAVDVGQHLVEQIALLHARPCGTPRGDDAGRRSAGRARARPPRPCSARLGSSNARPRGVLLQPGFPDSLAARGGKFDMQDRSSTDTCGAGSTRTPFAQGWMTPTSKVGHGWDRERDRGGLCGDRRRLGGLRAGEPPERGRRARRAAGGGADRLASDDPRAGGRAEAALQSARQLELRHRPRARRRRPPDPLAARARARRLELDQRHAVDPRQPRRLRRLVADGLQGLVVRRGDAALQVDRALRAGRRRAPRQVRGRSWSRTTAPPSTSRIASWRRRSRPASRSPATSTAASRKASAIRRCRATAASAAPPRAPSWRRPRGGRTCASRPMRSRRGCCSTASAARASHSARRARTGR